VTTVVPDRPPAFFSRLLARAGPGFTLAELAVVIFIIALLLGVALPRLLDVNDSEQLRTAARRIAMQAMETHSEAATKSRPWFFCVDLDTRQTWLSTVRPGREGDAGRESPFYNLPRGIFIKDLEHPTLGMIREGRAAFGYWPQGGSEPGTIHLTTSLTDDNAETLTLFLRPFLGRTEIGEGYLREEIQ
jgi:prepilin-type N-terminal cleavage/methylation domain-containing protein